MRSILRTVICDECKTPIERGESYSLAEFGRLHSRCLRAVAEPHQFVDGRLRQAFKTDPDGELLPAGLEVLSPLFVLQRL